MLAATTASVLAAGEEEGQFAVSYRLRNAGAASLSLDRWPGPLLIGPTGQSIPATAQAMLSDQDFFGTLQSDLPAGAQTTIKAVWHLPAGTVERNGWRIAFPGHDGTPVDLP